jgi:carboxylesterase
MLINPQLAGDSFLWPGTGTRAGTGILLSHGFCATTAEVRPLAKILNEAGYTVAGPLLPGHKTTPDDLATKHWQDWAGALEDTHALLRQNCDRIVVGGESLGGLLAVYHTSQHPEVAALLTYAPAVQLPAFTYWATTLLGPFVKEFTPNPGPRTVVDDVWQGYRVRPARAVGQLHAMMKIAAEKFPGLKPPLLIVQGRLDQSIVANGAQTLYERAGSLVKELHWFEQSTHCVILDKELPAVGDLTLKFVAKVLGAETV